MTTSPRTSTTTVRPPPSTPPTTEHRAGTAQTPTAPSSRTLTVGLTDPTLTTTASPTTVTLGTASPTLSDTATLSGGNSPTGSIVFTLAGPGGFSFTQTDTVTGDGSYPASTALPTTGTVPGTYTWTARYGGDANNSAAHDQGGAAEQTVVAAASPTLLTTASPPTLFAGVTLKDSAALSGGYFPTGTITFFLFFNGGSTPVDTETVTVNGNGTYGTPAGFTPPTGTGTYAWTAHYSGDANNGAASDQGGPAEQVVPTASPSLVTTATPSTATLPLRPTPALSDSAVLSGGFFPTGTITFTLTGPAATVLDTETVTVNGNSTYTTPTGFTLPTTGTVAGTYTWTARYGGDGHNNPANDQGGTAEQTTVNGASPTLVTTASPVVTVGTGSVTFADTAVLSGGFNPTGTITFALECAKAGRAFTQTDTVTGNGTYTASIPVTISLAFCPALWSWLTEYFGDANNNTAIQSEPVKVAFGFPTLLSTASPNVTLPPSPPGTPALSDSATLSGGSSPTGSIVFTLTGPGGSTLDTETVTVTGDGTYTTPTDFTLPTTGTVTGTYSWSAFYGGDVFNNPAKDQGGTAEQTVVGPAAPTVVTTPGPATLTLGTASATLSDSAALSGGYFPTGSIVFTLTGPGGSILDTETVTVTGNGTYTTPTDFTLPTIGTVAGTYTWSASYSGDANNNPAKDQGGIAEQTVVIPAAPILVMTASPVLRVGTGPPTLSDTAVLEGGYFPTGSMLFILSGPGNFVFTQTDTVNGNGTYTASTTLPTTGTVAGTYVWSASYIGDANNEGSSASQTTAVAHDFPTLVTTASTNATLPTGPPGTTTLSDLAVLSGGFNPTGSIVFTLTGPGEFSFTHTDTVTGDATYTASTTLPTTGTVAGTYTWTAQYGGDANNNPADDQGGSAEQTTVSPASPTLLTTASPTTLVAGVTLKDSAALSSGYFPTGTITFVLFFNGGSTPVDTETVTVTGNGTYRTPSGFTPSTGTGTYAWTVHYSGDANNSAASDQGGPAEQVPHGAPTLLTTASPATLTLPGSGTTSLSDSAVLSGGLNPTGSIVFTLTGPAGTVVDTETVTVRGNATYTTPSGFTLPTTGTVAGTYTWTARYGGDANNIAANDQGGTAEQTVVSAASPTVVTTAGPFVRVGTAPPTLSDTAVLSGGYFPTGSIVFTLTGPGGFSSTQTDTVSGDATYMASTSLPTTGTAAGTYTWSVSYGGDANNNPANDEGGAAEKTFLAVGFPSLVTTASSNATLPTGPPGTTTLRDSAVFSGGSSPTGSIVFTLTGPGGFSFTHTDAVTGDATYTASATLATTGTVAGTYTWTAQYGGDANNNPADDQGGSAEQTTVSPASPTLLTTASPAVRVGTGPPTLSDSAVLSGGYFPTGTIEFALFGLGVAFTEFDTVSGNGTYTATATLPTTGPVGTRYTWIVDYLPDANNKFFESVETATVAPAFPTLLTTASPNVTLPTGPPGTLTLSDSAVLSGGFGLTGAIVFTLTGPGGFSHTQTDTVSGNATYTASTTLPTTGAVAGTYTWTAQYGGDANNNPADDQGGVAEQTVVSSASPTVVTSASPNVTLPTGPPGTTTLSDAAVLSGGYFPTGSIVFTLTGPSGFSFTETDTVSGDATYMASTSLPTTGTVAGTYTWTVSYGGDANNNTANDQGGIAEQTVVATAAATLVSTASPTSVTLSVSPAPVLKDSATISGGFDPTGTVTFTLAGPGGTVVDTEKVAVSGNGSYATPTGFTLPTTGTVAGTYTWSASYGGDANNISVSEVGSATNGEQTVVAAAAPTLATIAGPTVVLGSGVALSDSATLAGGFHPTGTVTFTLTGPGGSTVDTEKVTVAGNGSYATPTPLVPTAAGTYQWVAAYSGDINNHPVASHPGDEPQTVVPAAATLVSTASPTSVTLSVSPAPVLKDSATISGGFDPTGTVTFTLAGPGGTVVDTEKVAVSGNGSYATPTGFTLPTTGTVAGTYTWSASYGGDANNISVSEVGSATNGEQTVVAAAAPTLVATASPTQVTLPADPPTLTDIATLSGGFHPTGSITFTLAGPGGSTVDTEKVTVNGNGSYATPTGFTLQTSGAVAGTYIWTAHYSGDANNDPANDQNPTAERTVVRMAASPTAASPAAVAPTSPAPASPAPPAATTPSALPLTGAAQTTLVGFAAAAMAIGLALTALTRRRKHPTGHERQSRW